MRQAGPGNRHDPVADSLQQLLLGLTAVPDGGRKQPPPFVFRQEKPFLHRLDEIRTLQRRIARPGPLDLGQEDVDQVRRKLRTEMGGENQLPDQAVRKRGLPAALRGIVLVHEFIGLLPDDPIGKGRRVVGHHFAHRDQPGLHFVQDQLQVGQVEMVVQTLPPGFEQDRKILVAQHRLQQLLGSQPVEPERHPFFDRRLRQK
ncbi:MAG: hypothetical protein ACD_75C01729G0002 [uncultured bacterium]|nr:MAG: hypothetical protein ACD_75C01729G0002 [uncultured bacterium]